MANKHQYVETALMTAIVLVIVLALVVLQLQFDTPSRTLIQPSFIALGLIPVVFYLIATDRLQQFRGAGFEVVLRRQAYRALGGVGDAEIEPVEEDIKMKERLTELREMDEEERPTVLAFEIGREGFYEEWAIYEYLDVLSENLKYVLFVDEAGQFEGYTHLDDFEALLQSSDDLIDDVETGDVLGEPAVNTAAVPQDSSNKAALQEMDRRRVDEVAVLSPNDRFVGVVTQDELVRKLLTEAIQEV